jgi:SAM-dependent methyltransferase
MEHPKWKEAQSVEESFWDGIVREDHALLQVLADNARIAPQVRKCFNNIPQTCLEVGVGPLSVGVSGFLPEIPQRFALDPLDHWNQRQQTSPTIANEKLRQYLCRQASELQYMRARGEEIPVQSESMDFVICSNALDHASNPESVLREMKRVMKPKGLLFLEVDTFSALGLVKWHLWTKRAHRQEILVRAHPHRLADTAMVRSLGSCGFAIKKLHGHTTFSQLVGRSQNSIFLCTKTQ